MELKDRLKALGFTATQMKGKDDAALQALHDDKVLEYREQGRTLPWDTPAGPTDNEQLGDNQQENEQHPPQGPPGQDDEHEGVADPAPQPHQPDESDLNPAPENDMLAAMNELVATLLPVQVRFGFTAPAPDTCLHDGSLVMPGQNLYVDVGDKLMVSEATRTWLAKQGLIKG